MHGITDDEKGYLMTLENIYKYASDEDLESIVHSIIGRLWEQCFYNSYDIKPTDKMLHILAKGLRKPQ